MCTILCAHKNWFLHLRHQDMCVCIIVSQSYLFSALRTPDYLNTLCDGNYRHLHDPHQNTMIRSVTAISQSLCYVGIYRIDKHNDQEQLGDKGIISSYSLINHEEKPRQELQQGKKLEAGTEVETLKRPCLAPDAFH